MADQLTTLGRYSGPATLILSSLAGGEKHGYALMQDIEEFAGMTLRPGTLYGALSRLEAMELIEAAGGRRPPSPVPAHARRRGRAGGEARRAAAVADVGLSGSRPRG